MTINDPTTFAAKVTGFTDGEGSFQLLYRNVQSRSTPVARFMINVRADEYMIVKIRDFFGCGRVVPRKAYATSKPQSSFALTNIADLANIIVPHFEKYLLESKKERDFVIWKQAVTLIFRVTRRGRRFVLGHRGWIRTWSNAELAEFESLRVALRDQRRFESSGLIITPPTNGHADPQGLLF